MRAIIIITVMHNLRGIRTLRRKGYRCQAWVVGNGFVINLSVKKGILLNYFAH